MRKKELLPKIAVTAAVLALLLCAASFASLFVAARGPSGETSRLLCATMVEKNFPFTDWFFTTGEISRAGVISRTESAAADYTRDDYLTVPEGSKKITGEYWEGYLLEFAPGSRVGIFAKGNTPDGCAASLDISSDCDALFYGGCLYYTVDMYADRFDFFAVLEDGTVEIVNVNATEAVNGGYECGISSVCVLVKNGIPSSGLGGGYSARAAIGMREDGSVILFAAVSTSVYPCGMTYAELASVMFEYGARDAVALQPAGEMRYGGAKLLQAGRSGGCTIAVVAAAPENDE